MQRALALAHALSDETRWRIAALIVTEALCVCELADILGLPQSTLSSHLQVMRKSGLVDVERCEKWAYYRLQPEAFPVWSALQALAGAAPDAQQSLLSDDAQKAAARLAMRGQTDCKGPRLSIPPARVPRPAFPKPAPLG